MNELLLIEESEESDCDKLEDDVDVEIEDNSGFKKNGITKLTHFSLATCNSAAKQSQDIIQMFSCFNSCLC